jgi:predicted type IV restriction endonuclease
VPPAEAQPTTPAQETPSARPTEGSSVVTTEAEMEVYEYVRHRLPFLIERDEDLFRKLDNLSFRDYKGTFVVSYKQVQKGKLFNFREGADVKYRFEFPESDETINTDELSDIDDKLLAVFMKRVEQLG